MYQKSCKNGSSGHLSEDSVAAAPNADESAVDKLINEKAKVSNMFGTMHRARYLRTGVKLLLGQRFSACFVSKFDLQRGEGEKREGVQISKQNMH